MGDPKKRFSIKSDRLLSNGDVKENVFINIMDGLIESVTEKPLYPSNIVVPSGSIVIPGMIDIHTHGYNGIDSMRSSASDMIRWSTDILKTGVTGFVPTCVSSGTEKLLGFIGKVKEAMGRSGNNGAAILGSRLEGPYISLEKAGAHNPDEIRVPGENEVSKLVNSKNDGFIMIDIAPEVDGAKKAIISLLESGVIVSAGHTNSTFETANEAIGLGVKLFTHFYDAMSGLHHRKPGMVGAGLLSKTVKLEIISDFKHVSPDVIDIAVKMRGWDNILLITDSISAAGLGDGQYVLGNMEVEVESGTCYISGTKTLAGSTLTMDEAVRNLVGKGHPIEEVVKSATYVPASLLGLKDRGEIRPGMRADISVLDSDLRVTETYVRGNEVYSLDST